MPGEAPDVMAHSIFLFICLIIISGLLAPGLHRMFRHRVGFILALFPASAFIYFFSLIGQISTDGPLYSFLPWADGLGISLSFFVDGLSLLFLLIVSGIGTLIVLYANGYLHGSEKLGKFFCAFLLFMASMLGIVSADNLILLFIFWELTSITSFMLIGYYHDQPASRTSALQALMVTGIGGLAMLAGFILLGSGLQTYDISILLRMSPETILAAPYFTPALCLILLGAFTKSAQFPFHFWLPNAMAAPTPVSAFLHSATMVKAGIFLLARLHPVLSLSEWWIPLVAPVGAFTMLLGVTLGFGQQDLKKILAYTTLSVLGTLTLLLGIGTKEAIHACMIYLVAHALYKATLFMTSGSIDHETGTRDIRQLSGLRSKMPLTAATAGLAALSMIGLPLFIGFLAKESLYHALLDLLHNSWLWIAFGVAASILMACLAIVTGIRPFFGKASSNTPKPPHEPPLSMTAGPAILAVLGLYFGFAPATLNHFLIHPATTAILAEPDLQTSLHLWHGINTALILSICTLIAALLLFWVSPRLRTALLSKTTSLAKAGPEAAYFGILNNTLRFADWQTRLLQNGKLRNYLLTIGAFTVFLLLLALPESFLEIRWQNMTSPTLLSVTTCILIALAAIFTCFVKSRFTAIVSLGVVGTGVAILFFLFSAPDLAMTQILVETLALVFFVLAFYKLPFLKDFSSTTTRVRDAILATAFGAIVTVMIMVAFHTPSPTSTSKALTHFMSENSYLLAHGRNVVNVILVDFRGLDTMGEITVLAIAALGIFSLIKLVLPSDKKKDS